MSPGNHSAADSSAGREGGSQTFKALAVVAVAVVVGVLILHRTSSSSPSGAHATTTAHHSTSTTTAPPATSSTVPASTVAVRPPSSVKLRVLNGVLTGNLAGQMSAKLAANPGYNTLAPDNATRKVLTSSIYVVTPGYGPEALALAQTLGLASTGIVTAPPPANAPIPTADLNGANLILIIGPDLADKV
jgi:hypothetical protein